MNIKTPNTTSHISLRQVASTSDSPLVTLQCTQMRLPTSNSPVHHHLVATSKNQMLTYCPVTSNPVKTDFNNEPTLEKVTGYY